MLEILLNFNILTLVLNPSQTEFWIKTLQENQNLVAHMTPNLSFEKDQYTDYIEYLVTNNRSSNGLLNLIHLLLENEQHIVDGVSKSASNLERENATFLVKTLSTMTKELFKFCSRLFVFDSSPECLLLRNLTLNDDNFIKDTNINIFFFNEFFNGSATESEIEAFYDFFDTYIQPYSRSNDTCGYRNSSMEPNLDNLTDSDLFSISLYQGYSSTCQICPFVCMFSYNRTEIKMDEIIRNPTKDIIYSAGLIVSIVFLVLTIAVFVALPALIKSLHGKCTLFHLISMTAAYICLSLVQLYLTENIFCKIIGHIMQFGFLAMFFWLNVMCFDILLAFCFLENRQNYVRSERKEVRKLLWYCSYGWGGPMIILAITLLMEYTNIMDDDNHLKPIIGGPKCFFQNVETQWLFLYGPIGCLIVANLVMFAITALTIYRHSKTSDLLQSSENSSSKSDNNRLKVYVNLFILMGVNWAAEALSWALPRNDWFFYITDITTTLQGLLVFVLFVCKPRIIKELRIKFGCPPSTKQSSSNKFETSSSSDKATCQTTVLG